jgi:excisionase family DNA binding protein
MSDKVWLTVRDAATYLGVSPDFIRDMFTDGLPMYKVRHTCFAKKTELDEYIERKKI